MKPLFESLETRGGIGLYTAWFLARNFPPTGFSCSPPIDGLLRAIASRVRPG